MSRASLSTLVIAVVLTLARAHAADVSVRVRTADGAPVKDAVVSIAPAHAPASAGKFPWRFEIAQRDLAFDPFVLIVPAGAHVHFPNFDAVRHHVYSFSPAKKFEIQLYGKDDSRSAEFPTPGVVAIGCNIHDKMSAFIYVADTSYAAKTDAAGVATITGVPDGDAVIRTWHPHAAVLSQRIEQQTTISAASANTLVAEISLRPQRRVSHGSY